MRRIPITVMLALALVIPADAAAQQPEPSQAERLEAQRAERLWQLGQRRMMLSERGDRGEWAGLYGRCDDFGVAYGLGSFGCGPSYGCEGLGCGGRGWGGQGWQDRGWGDVGLWGGRGGWGRNPVVIYPQPNPYRDWARLWGQGWLDDTAVPPYHRFQYRFFPETLPDPTRDGYPPPPFAYDLPPSGPPPGSPARRAGSCARLDMELNDGESTAVYVALPVLGALTPDALGAVVRERLRRGAGVVVRDVDGYVFQFPPADAIRRLDVNDC